MSRYKNLVSGNLFNKMNKMLKEDFGGVLQEVDKIMPREKYINILVDTICKEQKRINYVGNTQLMDKETWEEINQTRTDDQINSLTNTRLYNVKYFEQQNLETKNRFKYIKLVQLNRQIRDKKWFKQHVLFPGMTFSQWLTTLTISEIDNIWLHYDNLLNMIDQGKFKNINFQSILKSFGKRSTELPNGVQYNVDTDSLLITNNKITIYFNFVKKHLNVSSLQVPGFDILYRRYKKSKFMEGKTIKKPEYKNIDVKIDRKCDIDSYFFHITKISEYLQVTEKEYLKALFNINPYVFYHEETGKLQFANYLNLPYGREKILKYLITDANYNENNINIGGVTFINTGKIPWAKIFLLDDSEETFETCATRNKDILIYRNLLCLYISMSSFGQPIQVVKLGKVNLNDVKIVKKWKYDNNFYVNSKELSWDDHLNEEAFYPFKNQSKVTNQNGKKEKNNGPSNVDVDDLINKDYKKILQDNKNYFDLLMEKMKIGKLKNKEIRFINNFFYYSNKGSWQCSNIKMRTMLNIINNKRGRYLEFIDVIKERYGGSANVVVCLFIFFGNIKLSEVSQEIIDDYGVFFIKDSYWISITKDIADLVKTETVYNGKELGVDDFKNLQYIDNFVGPMGDDGKDQLQSISQRVYIQHQKTILAHYNNAFEEDGIELAHRLCYVIMKKYWDEVHTDNNNEFRGINDLILNRDVYSTDSGAGGLLGQFSDKKVLELSHKIDKGFMARPANKKSAFQSEQHDWYLKVIFDLPLTICDMILKRKENAKLRYIYSVISPHYFMNTIATRHLESSMNKMGVKSVITESDTILHNFRDEGLFFNCVDYSEFNDQHESFHKKLIWLALIKSVEDNPKNYGEFKDEFIFVCNWMAQACELMFMRLKSDNSILYEHKGRLFSGERSTTLTNSLMSVFYFALVTINVTIINKDLMEEQFEEVNLFFKTNYLDEDGYIYKSIMNNECLGDDGKAKINTIIEGVMFNEVAIFSGLMLKLNKCLIGVGIAEFLRKVIIKDPVQVTITKGYPNRAIASMVCGNPEGSLDRNYIQLITQMYEMTNTLRIRSNNSSLVDDIIEESWKWISRLNQKNKEENNIPLPIELLYTEKEKGGLGFVRSDGYVWENNVSFPSMRQPGRFSSKEFAMLKINAIIAKIQNIDLQGVLQYGDVYPKGIQMRIFQEKLNYFQANNLELSLYSEQFLKEFKEYNKKVQSMVNGKYVQVAYNETLSLSYKNMNLLRSKMDNYLSVKANIGVQPVARMVEKIDSLKRNLIMVKTKDTFENICISTFGQEAYAMYLSSSKLLNYNILNEKIEPNGYNEIFSYFYYNLGKILSIKEIRIFMNYYLSHGVRERVTVI